MKLFISVLILSVILYTKSTTEIENEIKDNTENKFFIDQQNNKNQMFYYDLSDSKNSFLYFSITCEGFLIKGKLSYCISNSAKEGCKMKINTQKEYLKKSFDGGDKQVYYYKIENINKSIGNLLILIPKYEDSAYGITFIKLNDKVVNYSNGYANYVIVGACAWLSFIIGLFMYCYYKKYIAVNKIDNIHSDISDVQMKNVSEFSNDIRSNVSTYISLPTLESAPI